MSVKEAMSRLPASLRELSGKFDVAANPGLYNFWLKLVLAVSSQVAAAHPRYVAAVDQERLPDEVFPGDRRVWLSARAAHPGPSSSSMFVFFMKVLPHAVHRVPACLLRRDEEQKRFSQISRWKMDWGTHMETVVRLMVLDHFGADRRDPADPSKRLPAWQLVECGFRQRLWGGEEDGVLLGDTADDLMQTADGSERAVMEYKCTASVTPPEYYIGQCYFHMFVQRREVCYLCMVSPQHNRGEPRLRMFVWRLVWNEEYWVHLTNFLAYCLHARLRFEEFEARQAVFQWHTRDQAMAATPLHPRRVKPSNKSGFQELGFWSPWPGILPKYPGEKRCFTLGAKSAS